MKLPRIQWERGLVIPTHICWWRMPQTLQLCIKGAPSAVTYLGRHGLRDHAWVTSACLSLKLCQDLYPQLQMLPVHAAQPPLPHPHGRLLW